MPIVKVVIERDDQPACDPREDDNLGRMICFHRRYKLGDEHGMTLREAFSVEGAHDNISLPLYLYDHSGLTIATTPFDCPFDSGKIGFIYVTKQHARHYLGVKRITNEIRDRIIEMLKEEVKQYDHYLRGNVFTMIEYDENNQVVNSCGGYIGDLYDIINEAKSIYPDKVIVFDNL